MRRQAHACTRAHKSREGMSARPIRGIPSLVVFGCACARGCWALPKSNSGQDKGLYRIVQADSSIRDCVRMYVHRCT